MTLRYHSVRCLCLLALTCALLPGDQRSSQFSSQATTTSQTFFSAQLVQIGESNTPSGNQPLGFFGATLGTDSLSSGSVQVTQDRSVAVQLQGAAVSATYTVMFCSFGFSAASGCVAVGQIDTNTDGDGTASLTFPASSGTSDTWVGAFVLTRTVSSATVAEFISGFAFPPTAPSPSTGVELQLSGEIQAISSKNDSFTLFGLSIAIDTGSTTKFSGAGVHSFTDLAMGDLVQVTGFTQPDGTIFATSVSVTPAKH